MLTSTRQKKKIYEYLKILYNERQNFNTRVLELKNKKIEILKKLAEYKKIMESYDKELNVEQEYDWYNFINIDKVDDLMKIPDNELKDYMSKKVNEDEKLKVLFEEEFKEEAKEKEEAKDKDKDKANVPSTDKKSPTQTIESKDKETISKDNNVSVKKDKTEDDDDDWGFEPRIRENKQTNDTNLQFEYTKLNELKYNYKKEILLKEINQLIDDFDNELYALKK